jgi:nitrous oxide reductase accessory protein NosL
LILSAAFFWLPHQGCSDEAFLLIVGGSKLGVMTQNPKWAFATKEAAQSFIDSNGGNLASWEATLLAAREDATPKPHLE